MGCCISRNKEEVENNPKETQNSPMRSNSCDLPRNPEEQASEKYIIKYSYNRQTNKRKSSSIFEKNSKLLSTSHTSDDNYFDYDSEAFKSVNIHNVPEINSNSILNSTRDGFKIPNPPLFNDNSVVVPRFDESDFESANENILETAKNDKILNDITLLNDLQETKNNYVSFSSNSILSQYLTPKEENNNNFIDLNGFSNMKYDFFYIEFHYFLLWNKEYLKGIYPDLNFILTIEINDDKSSLEKIILVRNGDDRYFPQRSSLNSEAFVRIMRVLNKETPFDNSEYNTHKLRFTIVNNTNNRLIPVCVEDVFISEKKLYEGMKIKFNQNLNMVYSSKKVGYILFNFAYRSEELNKNDLNEEKEKIFKYFSSLENTTKFVEEPLLIYRYHYVQNYYIKKNGSEQNRFKNNFTSIGDIQDTDFGGELSNEGIPLNRLLELFDLSKQAYDFYVILKKLSDYMSNSEFTEEKSLKLKEKIFNKLKEILEIKNNDIFLISLIFQILKKVFFKSKKENKSKFSKSSTPKSEVEIKQKMIEAARVQDINLGLMKSFLEISFDFLLEKSLPEEIPTASLNYIFKHFEEIIQNFFFDGKRKLSSDEFFCNYILINKRYEILAELLVRYPDNPSCVQTVLHVLNKTIKFRKEDCKEIINYFLFNINYEVITNKIIKTHDCNSFIMTSLMCFKYYIVDIYKKDIDLVFSGINFSKFREIFGTFRSNGFEQIHETIFYIIRNILSKREKESSQGEAISDDEFKEVIMILALALELIKGKIQLCKDFYKLASLLMNLLNYVYMICYIINGFPIKRKKICIEKKISELVIDCLAALNERKVFVSLDNAFKRYEIISLNSKTMVFRTLFHCIQLIKSLKENFPSTLTKPYAEKIYKVIKSIGDTDSVYNPEGIGKDIDKFCKKEDKMITTAHNNLKDYYSRYKKQEHEYVGEFLTICRS